MESIIANIIGMFIFGNSSLSKLVNPPITCIAKTLSVVGLDVQDIGPQQKRSPLSPRSSLRLLQFDTLHSNWPCRVDRMSYTGGWCVVGIVHWHVVYANFIDSLGGTQKMRHQPRACCSASLLHIVQVWSQNKHQFQTAWIKLMLFWHCRSRVSEVAMQPSRSLPSFYLLASVLNDLLASVLNDVTA